MIRIVVCDDMESVCRYYELILSNEPDFEVVGKAHNKRDSISLALEMKPDIMLVDMQMNTYRSGIEIIETVKKEQPGIKIIVLTVHDDNELIFKAYSLGIEDYFIKTLPSETLIKTIRDVYAQNHTLRPSIAQKLINECMRIKMQNEETKTENELTKKRQNSLLYVLDIMRKLSNSEFEILKSLYYGKTVNRIAEERFVSETTIRTHIGRILKKFNCSSSKILINDLKEIGAFDIFDSDVNSN